MTVRRLVGLCYNGNSLFLLAQFASHRGLSLRGYVPPELLPLARHLGLQVQPIRYLAVLADILASCLTGRPPLLVLPHAGGRFLRMVRRIFRTRFFVDDGFLFLGYDHFLRPTDTVVTFAEIAEFRKADHPPCRHESPTSLLAYADALKELPAPSLTRPTHLVVSSSELDDRALQALLDQPPPGSELRCIPHPRAYKDRLLFRSLHALMPSVPYGAEAVILGNLPMITGLTIGRSFTSYLVVAWLATKGRAHIVDIHRPPNCTRHFAELHRFCRWLVDQSMRST
jgi:hypothetical protein